MFSMYRQLTLDGSTTLTNDINFRRTTQTTDQQFQTIDITNDHGALSQETILKIQELKRLVYRYPQYYSNPDAIIKCATHWSINGDNTLLDGSLERLRMVTLASDQIEIGQYQHLQYSIACLCAS